MNWMFYSLAVVSWYNVCSMFKAFLGNALNMYEVVVVKFGVCVQGTP